MPFSAAGSLAAATLLDRLPILYSFRRCPYAIRARLAIFYANIQVELREVELRNKPRAMLERSPKGTVPVLVCPDGAVIDESRDIAIWALGQSDPAGLLNGVGPELDRLEANLVQGTGKFKLALDRYKYHDRHPDKSREDHRADAEVFLGDLNGRLSTRPYLQGTHPTLADILVVPFIRQFANVDREWFDRSDYRHVIDWLDNWLASTPFQSVMTRIPVWQTGQPGPIFPNQS